MTKNRLTFNIREEAEKLVPDRTERTSYAFSLLVCFVMIGIITLLLIRLPSVVPLYFTLPWGEGRLAPKLMLYIIPITLLLCLFLNFSLGRVANKISPLLPRVMAISTTLIAMMLAVALFGIVQSLVL